MTEDLSTSPFNSPLETGVRSLSILFAAFPDAFDLQRLIEMDYVVVHSNDLGGPESLHTPLPLRAGELLVRRVIIENGVMLMVSRGLISRISSDQGFLYEATDLAAPFIASLTEPYSIKLLERAVWANDQFKSTPTIKIRKLTNKVFEAWSSEFQVVTTRETP